MKKILAIILSVLVLTVTGCSSYDAQVDENAVEVDGYHFFKTDKKLVGCHSAGKSGWGGSGNDMYYYPAGQHTYSFTGHSSEEKVDPIPVVTSDSQTLQQPGFVKFTLTSSCQDLYDFHRLVGLKYRTADEDNWLTDFENDYLGVALSNALNDAVGQYGWRQFYTDSSLRTKTEDALTADMQDTVNQSLGNPNWIKINSVTLSKPIAPTALTQGLEQVQANQLKNQAQEQQNKVIKTKYDSITQCLHAGIPADFCQIVFLTEQGGITFYPVPQGSNLNVTPQSGQ